MRPASRQIGTEVPDIGRWLPAAREAQARWSRREVRDRLKFVRRLRAELVRRTDEIVASVDRPGRASVAETLSAELVPLADACRFLERQAERILRSRRLGRAGRPAWLVGHHGEVRRDPFGVVMVIGPSNYPLLLPAVQSLQALVAGNAVVLKPGSGGSRVAGLFATLARRAGLDPLLLAVVDESVDAARAALEAGVDKVVLTGSVETGRAVLARLAPRVIPATVELSGCDAVFVLPGADLRLVARAVAFGVTLNGGATCIAPRRVFVPAAMAAELTGQLVSRVGSGTRVPLDLRVNRRVRTAIDEATSRGARIVAGGPPADGRMAPTVLADVPAEARILSEDLFAPLVSIVAVSGPDEALEIAGRSPYALGATIFGPAAAARELAGRVRTGTVVINDMIVPTADPRVPFGGRGDSGFGVTRGAEGLLEMTTVKTVLSRRGRFRPHLERPSDRDAPVLKAWLRASHGGSWTERLKGCLALVREVQKRRR